jgi:hypothetical protein
MFQKSWLSIASLPIISSTSISTSINTSSIDTSTKETNLEEIFQTCYEKLLTIHESILYLNKIKRLALSFRPEEHAIHPSILLK